MPKVDVNVLIGGEAGAGVLVAGVILAKTCIRSGFYAFIMNEYPSLIRGGHVWCSIRICDRKVYSQRYSVDIMVALNDATLKRHKTRLRDKGIIIIDDEKAHSFPDKVQIIRVPLSKITRELGGRPVMRNSVAIGAVVALLSLDIQVLNQVIRDVFKERAVELNIKLARRGYEYILKQSKGKSSSFSLPTLSYKLTRNLLLTGNDAIALGAIKAGMRFFAAYPMTPASPILHFLAAVQKEHNLVVLQPESEIAAINMVIGAAYAGARAMTATSGGGFSLMVEALGQAAMTETPVVIVVAQRPGPSTGLPTYTAQGDLRFVLHASQGEFPRVIIAPGDVSEAFYLTIEAFNIAEKFQVPVILLTDKHLAESYMTIKEFDDSKIRIDRGELITGSYEKDEPYKRYKITETGISPRAVPGTLYAIVKANTSEHDEYGIGTTVSSKVKIMVDKRFRKIKYLKEYIKKWANPVKTYGEGDILLITWGSPKGAILEAMRDLNKKGIKTKLIQVIFLEPFPVEILKDILKNYRKIILIENNKTALLNTLFNQYLHLDIKDKLLKYDGRPFYPYEIIRKVMSVIK